MASWKLQIQEHAVNMDEYQKSCLIVTIGSGSNTKEAYASVDWAFSCTREPSNKLVNNNQALRRNNNPAREKKKRSIAFGTFAALRCNNYTQKIIILYIFN